VGLGTESSCFSVTCTKCYTRSRAEEVSLPGRDSLFVYVRAGTSHNLINSELRPSYRPESMVVMLLRLWCRNQTESDTSENTV
jgi:hypothetical protein